MTRNAYRLTAMRFMAAAVAALAPFTAHAQFAVYTDFASFLAATSNASVDIYSDLGEGPLASSLVRTVGSRSYTVSASTLELYGIGAADRWLSTNVATDRVTFDAFSAGVRGVGGFFFGTDLEGVGVTASSIVLRATNALGTTTHTVLNSTSASFVGFVSLDGDVLSLTVDAEQSGSEVWPTINDFTLAGAPSVVPEPSTVLLLGAGCAVLLLTLRRRTA